MDTLTIEWISGLTEVFTDVPAGIYTMLEGMPGTGAPDVAPATGSSWGVGPLAPQPARGPQSVRLMVAVGYASNLTGTVHDVAGRLVRELRAGAVGAGALELVWDGRDASAARVPAGVYFLRVTDGERTVTRKSTRLR